MLGNNPWNFKTTEKIVNTFLYLFSDITLQRFDPNGVDIKNILVPCNLGSKEAWAQRLISDPNAGNEAEQKHVSIVLPRLAAELVGFKYDPTRKLSSTNYRVNTITGTPKSVLRQLNPVPIIFNFSLYLQTRTLEDAWAICEQIIPFFQPDYVVPIMDIEEMNIKRDIVFTMVGNSHTDTWDGNFLDKRIINYQFDFEAKGHMYPPIKTKKVITRTDNGIYELGDTQASEFITSIITPDNVTMDQPFNIDITIED